MFPDPERKLLRILINYPSPVHKSRMPDLKRLERMTGRRSLEILRGLQYLEDHGYIQWSDKSTTASIIVLKDDNDLMPAKKTKRNLDYWMY